MFVVFSSSSCLVNCHDDLMLYCITESTVSRELHVKPGGSVARALPVINLAWKDYFLVGHSSRNRQNEFALIIAI